MQAQKFEDDFVFEVRKYDIRQKGYPSKIVGDGTGNASYYEFWEPGSGRNFTGYYLQTIDPDYAEQWFKPVFSKPELKFEPEEILSLDKGVVVTGYQYSVAEKKWIGQAHFFDREGNDKAFVRMDPTALKKFEAGHKSMYAVSPDAKRFVRMLHKPEEGSKSAFFVSSLLSDGKLEWASQLKLPFAEEKYKPVKICTDNAGKVWFLMMSEGLSGKYETDKNLQPIILCYNFRENQFVSWKVNVNGLCFPYGNMEISNAGKAIVCLAGGDNLGKGFTSGARNGQPFNWSKTYWFTLNGGKEITQEAFESMEVSEKLSKRFQVEGADFTGTGKIIQEGSNLLWVMESTYTQQKEQGKLDFYGDLLCSGFNSESNKPSGILCIEKKQRDIAGSVMCSYTACTSPGKAHIVYLSSVGADGKIYAESIDFSSMQSVQTEMLSNEAGDSYFYAEKSGQIAPGKLLLMGLGDTNKQEYRLLRFSFQ